MKERKSRKKSSWVIYILILALLGMVTLILLAFENRDYIPEHKPETNSLVNVNFNVDTLNLGHFFKRTTGNGWEMWDKEKPIVTTWTEHKEYSHQTIIIIIIIVFSSLWLLSK